MDTGALPAWFWMIAAGALGAIMGSFLYLVVLRGPERLRWRIERSRGAREGLPPPTPEPPDIVFKGSFCPSCSHPLTALDNVPLLSWLWLRGRCRHCHATIPARYFGIELAAATWGIASVALCRPTGAALALAFAGWGSASAAAFFLRLRGPHRGFY